MSTITILFILAACGVNYFTAAVKVTITGPKQPIARVPTAYKCSVDDGSTIDSLEWTTSTAEAFFSGGGPTRYLNMRTTSSYVDKAFNITCTVTIGSDDTEGTLEVTWVTEPATPKITQDGGVSNTFVKGGNYTLTCTSETSTDAISPAPEWSWLKGDKAISDSKVLKIINAKDTDKGDYYCSTTTWIDGDANKGTSKSEKFTVVISTGSGAASLIGSMCLTLSVTMATMARLQL